VRLIDATVELGVDGVTLLGVAAETKKLAADERRRVVDVGLETIAGRVPVVIGTSEDGTDATVASSRRAEADGAAALLVAPPTFVGPGPALTRHYARVGEAVDIPIVLQDFPPVNGVSMSPADMAALVEAVPTISTIKLEGTPTPQRVAQTIDLTGEAVTIVGGLGGLYLYYELESGTAGTMTGFAYPEILLAIWRAWRDGDRAGAAETYWRYLPMLVCEGQQNGIAIRKRLLARRGLITHATMREPAPGLHERVEAQVTATVEHLGLDAAFPLPAPQPS
jgi:4-hydroxy-tetrahydrodipicolinate synthase